jgi:intraflagellar transport protein 122
VHIGAGHWDDAFALVRRHPAAGLGDGVYLPYAQWLAEHDRFDEARQAFTAAGHAEMATAMLEALTHNAVVERRFTDAGYCYWLMSREAAAALPKDPRALLSDADEATMARFTEYKDRAEMYHAYDYVYRATDEPFRSSLPATLLNIGQFLLAKFATREEMPLGISLAYVLHTLATHGEALGAFKLARFAYNKLQGLRIPAAWQAAVDLACVVTRAKPFSDAEDLLPLCYRCSTTNPLVSNKGDACISCGGRFVRSFVTFEHLPMVEFEVADGISPAEARKLIAEDSPAGRGGGAGASGGGGSGAPSRSSRRSPGEDGFHERDMGGDVQTLMFDDGPGGGALDDDVMLRMDDPFTQQMAVPHAPIEATREMLRALPPGEVVVKPSGCALVPPRYFRLMDIESPVTVDDAGNFYETDEYELACLERGRTPYTRKEVTRDSEQASAPTELELPANDEKKPRGSWGAARGVHMIRGIEMGAGKGTEYDPSAHAGGPRAISLEQ